MIKFCKYQEIQKVCEEHDTMRRLCGYGRKSYEPYKLCPIQPEEIVLVPQVTNNALYLAYCARCPKFSPVNLTDYLKLTDLSFDKVRYLLVESDLEYLLVDKIEEQESLFKKEEGDNEYDE